MVQPWMPEKAKETVWCNWRWIHLVFMLPQSSIGMHSNRLQYQMHWIYFALWYGALSDTVCFLCLLYIAHDGCNPSLYPIL